jgi:protein ImuB
VPLIDRLVARLGVSRIFRLSAVESDIPERSVCRLHPLAETQAWPSWPRPVRFLSPAEQIEQVMFEYPDRPPRRFLWRGKLHRVLRADGPERIHGEWWKRSEEAETLRDYFRIEDEEGRRFWVYRRHEGETGNFSWWLQGTFG